MKKYLFFIQAAVMLAVSSVGLVSCGKDDVVHGGKTIVVYSVVGGWYKWLTSSTIIGCRFDANGDAYFVLRLMSKICRFLFALSLNFHKVL